MKRGKILSLLVATSIAAGTFAGVQVPKITYAQDVQQDENNIDSNNDDNSNTGDEANTEANDVNIEVSDSSENVSDINNVSIDSNSSDTSTDSTAVVLDNDSSEVATEVENTSNADVIVSNSDSKEATGINSISTDSSTDSEDIASIDTTVSDDASSLDNNLSTSEIQTQENVVNEVSSEDTSVETATDTVKSDENNSQDAVTLESNSGDTTGNTAVVLDNNSSEVATETEDTSSTDVIVSDSDNEEAISTDSINVDSSTGSEEIASTNDASIESNISSSDAISIDAIDIASNDDSISTISDTTNSIDTSQFDNQESFNDTNYDETGEEEVDEQSGFFSFFASKVSEGYYNFNISGAQKYTYGTSGKGRPLYYYKIGSGDKVLMVNFGIHGYEDAWAKDGEELTKLAKDLIERVAKDNSSGGLNGWTIVIIPTSNPDGVLDGSTNNGPGRCQISQKIDLNRSFPTFFTPQYSARNYTGSTALAAPEAKALASLVDQYSSSSSHMALVDVHGWLNQTIGDPSLGQAFDSSFGISNKLMSTSASGYLISYAHSKGALATLLELPMPSSSASITSKGYANKIYSGVKSIVNNGDGFVTMNAQGEVVNTNSLNIRITTSTNSNIIGSYSKGTKITILGKVGNWYQVKSSAGYGYVSADYIKVLSNNTNSGNNNGGSVEAPTTYETGKVSNISTSLNVRKLASTSASVITTLKNGTEVKVVGTEGTWYKIYSESFGYGYVSKSYITIVSSGNNNSGNTGGDNNQGSTTPETPSTPEIPSTPENTQTGQVINVTSKLNIRSGAGTNYGIVGTLGANATVNILGQEGSWYKISYNGVTGYVSSSYIKVNSSNNNTNTDTTVKYGKVVNVSTKLNVRKSASTSSSIVGTLANNTKVTILEKLSGWYKISYNGIVGYVSSSYLTEI